MNQTILTSLRTTSNNDLQIMANRLKIKLEGILMSDEIYKFMKSGIPDGFYILNLEDSNQQGSHWTSCVKQNNIIYYNDSYGVYPDRPLYDVMKEHDYKLVMNKRNHQHLGTQSCGYFAILYLYYMNKKKKTMIDKFREFNKLFTEDTKLNEILLEKMIKKLLKNKI